MNRVRLRSEERLKEALSTVRLPLSTSSPALETWPEPKISRNGPRKLVPKSSLSREVKQYRLLSLLLAVIAAYLTLVPTKGPGMMEVMNALTNLTTAAALVLWATSLGIQFSRRLAQRRLKNWTAHTGYISSCEKVNDLRPIKFRVEYYPERGTLVIAEGQTRAIDEVRRLTNSLHTVLSNPDNPQQIVLLEDVLTYLEMPTLNERALNKEII